LAKLNFELDLLEIIIVQCAVRRYLAQEEAARRRQAIQTIQNAARRHQAVHCMARLTQMRLEQQGFVAAAILVQVRIPANSNV
jgi:hypothetical protein